MPEWSQDLVEQVLREKGWAGIVREIQSGLQYSMPDGTSVNWYTTGKVVIGGRLTQLKQELEEIFANQSLAGIVRLPTGSDTATPRRVFIVYGHDISAREQLELILRRLRLEPIVLQNLPAAGDTIIEKLETLTAADFACVLLTPDDEGHRYGQTNEKRPRARQNVVLEMGMVLAKLGRQRVALLKKGGDLEDPSDIAGLIWLRFDQRVDEVKNPLAACLQNAGFPIQVADLLG